jgi:PhoD related phosphatase
VSHHNQIDITKNRGAAMLKLGPVLQFLGCHDHVWGVSALVVTSESPPTIDASFRASNGKPLATTHHRIAVPGLPCIAWRFDIAVVQTDEPLQIELQIGDAQGRFQVPAAGTLPSLAFASCNGFSDPRAIKKTPEVNALWARMGRLHRLEDRVDNNSYGPHHLLLLGGDQVYSDGMWSLVPELAAWSQLDWASRVAAPFTAAMESRLTRYFSQIYLDRWSQPDVAKTLASVPAVMIWDDHDLMDGWGSHPAELHFCPVFQGIYRIARAAFELFQRQMMGVPAPATLPDQSAHNSGYRMAGAGLLVLDMRSERRPRSGDVAADGGQLQAEHVMSEESWRAVYRWLDQQEATGDMTHLFVVSSIPVVHPSFETLEKMLGVLPGQQSLEDDLRDHWTSPPHKAERLRLIHRLLAASATGIRITLLSGDVHVAAIGVIESDRSSEKVSARVINQLTSSGIVHPPPPGVALYFLEQACKNIEQIDRGITGTMYEFPTTSHRMIGCRNFLTLQPDAPGGADRYWANWWAEGEPHPYTKVIHAVN